jgi:hypothetical protein
MCAEGKLRTSDRRTLVPLSLAASNEVTAKARNTATISIAPRWAGEKAAELEPAHHRAELRAGYFSPIDPSSDPRHTWSGHAMNPGLAFDGY